jgi:hypothetical protein
MWVVMVEKKVWKMAGSIMPALVWKGVLQGTENHLCPISADKASVAFGEAIVAAINGEYPSWSDGFFDLTGCKGSKIYFDTVYGALQISRKLKVLDDEFMEAALYLFEPKEVGDSRDPGISTIFAERWGFCGWTYPDYASGYECNVRWKILQFGKEEYGNLPENIQIAIDKVASHIPPILKKILEIE